MSTQPYIIKAGVLMSNDWPADVRDRAQVNILFHYTLHFFLTKIIKLTLILLYIMSKHFVYISSQSFIYWKSITTIRKEEKIHFMWIIYVYTCELCISLRNELLH